MHFMSTIVRMRQEDIWRLAAEAHRDPTTVKRVLEGKGTTSLSRAAIIEAAKRLAIALPPGFEDPPPTRLRAT